MGDIVIDAAAASASAAAADAEGSCPPKMNKETNLFMQIVVNPDGTVTRPDVPLVPTSESAAATTGGGVMFRDVPLDATNDTYLRLYLPVVPDPASPATTATTNAKLPIILYFHGGGFVILSPATVFYHGHCSAMAAAVPAIVASLEYRLAPEHRLPAAYDDACAAVAWLRDGARDDPWVAARGDLSRCFLMGGSSGGSMAFFAALRTAGLDLAPAAVRGLMLHQPYLGGVDRTPSEARSGDDVMLPLEANDMLWRLALPLGADRDHEFCNPVKAMAPEALAGRLPPRCLVTGNVDDPLIDRQREFARWLQEHRGQAEVVVKTDGPGFHAAELFVPEIAEVLFAAMREFMSTEDA